MSFFDWNRFSKADVRSIDCVEQKSVYNFPHSVINSCAKLENLRLIGNSDLNFVSDITIFGQLSSLKSDECGFDLLSLQSVMHIVDSCVSLKTLDWSFYKSDRFLNVTILTKLFTNNPTLCDLNLTLLSRSSVCECAFLKAIFDLCPNLIRVKLVGVCKLDEMMIVANILQAHPNLQCCELSNNLAKIIYTNMNNQVCVELVFISVDLIGFKSYQFKL